MSTQQLSEIVKESQTVQTNIRNAIKSMYQANPEDRKAMVKGINDLMGLPTIKGGFNVPDEYVEHFNKLDTQEEKDEFIQARVDRFIKNHSMISVDPKEFEKGLSKIPSLKGSEPENAQKETTGPSNEQGGNSQPKPEAAENNGNKDWDNNFDRTMKNLEKNNPEAYKIVSGIPKNSRENILNHLIRSGRVSENDIYGHEGVHEKPVEYKEESRINKNQDPNNFVNPKASLARTLIDGLTERKRKNHEFDQYKAEKAAQDARQDIQRCNINRIERGTSDCISKYSDARVVQGHNIEDYNKECARKIPGLASMSKDEQEAAINKQIATDPEFKTAHDRVVRGYKELGRYDTRMLTYLDSAKNSGVDVTRNAEEYDQLKNKPITPANVESSEITTTRQAVERMVERIREAVVGLMNRFGFSRSNSNEQREPEVQTTQYSSTFSGPSNG